MSILSYHCKLFFRRRRRRLLFRFRFQFTNISITGTSLDENETNAQDNFVNIETADRLVRLCLMCVCVRLCQ